MDKKQVDSIIWGDFDKRITEKEIPFYAATGYHRETSEELLFLLPRLFVNFVFEKLGYENSLISMNNLKSENYMDWVDKNNERLDYIGENQVTSRVYSLPPVYFMQFKNKENVEEIFVVNNTYAFFQALQLFKELGTDISFEEINEKYKIHNEQETKIAFGFIKNIILHNKGNFQNPTLILRPLEMVLKLRSLDDHYEDYFRLPHKLFTKEDYEKLSLIERAGLLGLSEEDIKYGPCNDNNFKDLIKEYSDFFPDFEFMTFYDLLKNKIPLELQDWNKKRDGFIKNLEHMIEYEYSSEPLNFDREYEYLQKGQKMHDEGNFEESILNCHKALEGVLGKIYPQTQTSDFYYKLKECSKDSRFSKYVGNLSYINKIRNSMSAHASPIVPNVDDSLIVLQMTNITFSGLTKHRVYGKYDTFEK
ncbi:hypothetical protein NMT12_100021 [metagenome]